jgi:hypothetical protein
MPTATHLLAVSVVARLPLATFTTGVLVHVEHLTGSYAVAGLASGALAVAQRLGGPLLGLWGAGSLLGGIAAARPGGRARTGTGLALLVAALAAGHVAIAWGADSVVALAILIAVAGSLIARRSPPPTRWSTAQPRRGR